MIVPVDGKFADLVLELTQGGGAQVIYDGNGGETFEESVKALAFHGTLAAFGPMVAPTPPIDIFSMPKSIKLTYPVVGHHVRTPEDLRSRSAQLFDWVRAGKLRVPVGGRYPLAEASQAHTDIESRVTTGKLLLIP